MAGRVAWVAGSLFLLTFGFILTKSGRDALYFQEGGIRDLPWAYVGVALVSMPTALMTLQVMTRFGTRRVRVSAPVLVAAYLGVVSIFASPGGGPLMTAFFTTVPVVFGIIFSVAWLLAAELSSGAPAAVVTKIYSRTGAMSILGGIAGGSAARGLSGTVGPHALLQIGAVSLVLAGVLMHSAHRRYPAPDARQTARLPRMNPLAAMREAIGGPYSRRLLMAGAAGAFVGVMVELQLFLAAASSAGGAEEKMAFFGGIYAMLNVGALVVQLFVLPGLQRSAGVRGTLRILPMVMLGGAVVLSSAASVFARSLLRVTEGGLKASVHRVSWEQAFVPVDPTSRAHTKVIVDGVGARLAEGAAAIALLLWFYWVVGNDEISAHSPILLNALLITAAAAWVWAVRSVGANLDGFAKGDSQVVRVPDS